MTDGLKKMFLKDRLVLSSTEFSLAANRIYGYGSQVKSSAIRQWRVGDMITMTMHSLSS